MKTQYYKLTITSIGYSDFDNYPEGGEVIDTHEEGFETIEEVKDYIKDSYPEVATWNGTYVDDKKGNPIQVGWIASYYNRDISHDSDPWWQEDWISIYKVQEEAIIPTTWEMEP